MNAMTKPTAILYYVVVILSSKLVRVNDLGEGTVSQDIYEGGLSRYLLYPEGYLPLKYAQQVGGLVPAIVQFAAYSKELHTAGSYLSSSDKRLHFGLGTDTKAQKVEIHWASGIVQVLKDIPGGQTGRVDEPVGTAQPTSK